MYIFILIMHVIESFLHKYIIGSQDFSPTVEQKKNNANWHFVFVILWVYIYSWFYVGGLFNEWDILYGVLIRLSWFSFILNLLRGRPVFELGTDFVDKLIEKLGNVGVAVLKSALLIVTLIMAIHEIYKMVYPS